MLNYVWEVRYVRHGNEGWFEDGLSKYHPEKVEIEVHDFKSMEQINGITERIKNEKNAHFVWSTLRCTNPLRFEELSPEAKLHATIWFNSEYDAYGVNGEREYEPLDIEGFAQYAEDNGWEFNEDGDRVNF